MSKIIGITGHTERGHDGSVALIQDGKIIFLAEEERFSRIKHAYDSFPTIALKRCLEYAKLKISDIDYFATGWDYNKLYKIHGRKWNKREYLSSIGEIEEDKIVLVDHHISHAASAFFTSGFKDSLILVIDGQGEKNSTSIFITKNGEMELVYATPVSFGYYFSAVTKHCGFCVGEEGKTMGLVPYGEKNEKEIAFLKKHLFFDKKEGSLVQSFYVPQKKFLDEQDRTINKWKRIFNTLIDQKKQRIIDFKNSDIKYATFAKSCQEHMQNVIIQMVNYFCEKYNKHYICIAGGVGLSCKMNTRILEDIDIVKDVYVQPAANDGGVSLGAALYLVDKLKENAHQKMNPYLGTSYTDEDIEKELIKSGVCYTKSNNIEIDTAKLLANEKILAVFQGRFEFGPRALGNRSILANPNKIEVWHNLNKLKGRELWRPLAPILRAENTKYLFNTSKESPFMTFAFSVKDFAVENIPSGVHVDKSARMQTVTRDQNPFIYDTLKYFEELSGIKALINTSFNKKGEPIIESPQNAIESFIEMKLDNLIIGSFIVENKIK